MGFLFQGPYSVDWYLLQQLAGFRDGESGDTFSLTQ
jgi:hypothetical protein